MLAGLLKLSVLFLDFVEQPYVLDRNHCLVRERFHQLNLLLGEGPGLLSLQGENPNHGPLPHQWHTKPSSDADKLLQPRAVVFGIGDDVWDVGRAAVKNGTAED